jgi:hypothetical protein
MHSNILSVNYTTIFCLTKKDLFAAHSEKGEIFVPQLQERKVTLIYLLYDTKAFNLKEKGSSKAWNSCINAAKSLSNIF